MVEYLPLWLMKSYCVLWKKFRNREFDKIKTEKVLKGKVVSVALSKLRRAGWLEVRLDSNDARRSVYRLKDYEGVMKKIVEGYGK